MPSSTPIAPASLHRLHLVYSFRRNPHDAQLVIVYVKPLLLFQVFDDTIDLTRIDAERRADLVRALERAHTAVHHFVQVDQEICPIFSSTRELWIHARMFSRAGAEGKSMPRKKGRRQ